MTGLREDEPENDRLLAMIRRSLVMTEPMTKVDAICELLQRRLAARAAQTDATTAAPHLARAKQTADWDAAQGPATSHSPDDRTIPSLLAGILDALIACTEVRA